MTAMKFLRHIRHRSRVKEQPGGQVQRAVFSSSSSTGHDASARLPEAVLQLIFSEVCPLTVDDTYDSSEESLVDYGCALCDVKDLAQCALVSRKWYSATQELLYRNVRIEPVHYCEREYELAEKRKHKSFFERNADNANAPRERLVLLMRTLRGSPALASRLISLRLPYMTRESCKAELARTVAVLPHLRYVDVPEGFYSDDPSTTALRHELQISCPEIRRMKYNTGAERSLMQLPRQQIWQHLEILELCGLRFAMHDLAYVLGSLSSLRDLKLVDLPWLDDNIFPSSSSQRPSFPSVENLTLQNTPQIQAEGLVTYLSQGSNWSRLTQLSLSSTGVQPQQLHQILSKAPYLENLSILEAVQQALPADALSHPLASQSLKNLHYEITTSHSPGFGGPPPTASYYTYLSSSLLVQPPLLPNLTNLYVRDPHFATSLLLTPPSLPFSPSKPLPPPSSSSNLTQPLSVFSKGPDELEWNFTSFTSPNDSHHHHHQHQHQHQQHHHRKSSGSAARPVSVMGAESLSPAWGNAARKSVMVGNGHGGFLAVPSDEDLRRPVSRDSVATSRSGSRERRDLWR